jgi:hypothetical protein
VGNRGQQQQRHGESLQNPRRSAALGARLKRPELHVPPPPRLVDLVESRLGCASRRIAARIRSPHLKKKGAARAPMWMKAM